MKQTDYVNRTGPGPTRPNFPSTSYDETDRDERRDFGLSPSTSKYVGFVCLYVSVGLNGRIKTPHSVLLSSLLRVFSFIIDYLVVDSSPTLLTLVLYPCPVYKPSAFSFRTEVSFDTSFCHSSYIERVTSLYSLTKRRLK